MVRRKKVKSVYRIIDNIEILKVMRYKLDLDSCMSSRKENNE